MILLKVLIGVIVWIKLLRFSVNVTPEFIRRRIKKIEAKKRVWLPILLAIPVFFLAKKVGAPHPGLIAIGVMLTISRFIHLIFVETEFFKENQRVEAQIEQLLDQGKIKEALKLFGKHIKHTVSYSGMKETARETWRAWE